MAASLHPNWAASSHDQSVRTRYANQIAERLTATRLALSLSQVELCRISGLRQNTYNQFEKAVNVISLKQAFRLCEAFGMTLDWIYQGKASSLPSKILQGLPRGAILGSTNVV